MTADEVLREIWNELRNDASSSQLIWARGAIRFAYLTGSINEVEMDGWMARILSCPGHDPSRMWCAYCGDIKPEENE